MCKLVLDRGSFADFTSVSNVFIDEYMPAANGEFVKIYLHLLRLVNSSAVTSAELSTEHIADRFNLLDSDVMRALNYWSAQGLLSLSFNHQNQLSGITMEPVTKPQEIVEKQMLAQASGESFSVPIPESSGIIIPAKKKYSANQIRQYSTDERVQHLIFLAQTYLGKTLNSNDVNSILYMLEDLNFEVEFIEYIMETCISLGHKTLSSIEKQAVSYAKKGISSEEEAKNDEKLRRAIFKSIYKIFGSAPKAPVKKEISYVSKWTDDYGFTDEIILEACSRTMEHTHTGSFQYADSILTNWYNQNALSMDSIQKLDDAHAENMKETFKSKATIRRTKKGKSFEQRSYDYNDLEKQLLLSRDKKLQIKKID